MNEFAHVSPPAPLLSEHWDNPASLPLVRASVISDWAAASSLTASTGSTRWASFTVNAGPAGEFAGPCLASGGNEKSLLGELVVPSNARTEASYSALLNRRTRAGKASLEPVSTTPPVATALPPEPAVWPPAAEVPLEAPWRAPSLWL